MKKQLMAGMMAASMALSLAACGGSAASSAASAADSTSGAASTSTAASTSSDEQVTLRFAWWGGDERANATMEVINKFMEENPNIKIEAEYGSSDGYHDKLATQLASGTAADIVQIDPETMPSFVSTGDYFLDYKDYDFDLSNFDPNYIGLRVNGNYDGKQLGLPTGIAGPALVVNEELAEKYGIDFNTYFAVEIAALAAGRVIMAAALLAALATLSVTVLTPVVKTAVIEAGAPVSVETVPLGGVLALAVRLALADDRHLRFVPMVEPVLGALAALHFGAVMTMASLPTP